MQEIIVFILLTLSNIYGEIATEQKNSQALGLKNDDFGTPSGFVHKLKKKFNFCDDIMRSTSYCQELDDQKSWLQLLGPTFASFVNFADTKENGGKNDANANNVDNNPKRYLIVEPAKKLEILKSIAKTEKIFIPVGVKLKDLRLLAEGPNVVQIDIKRDQFIPSLRKSKLKKKKNTVTGVINKINSALKSKDDIKVLGKKIEKNNKKTPTKMKLVLQDLIVDLVIDKNSTKTPSKTSIVKSNKVQLNPDQKLKMIQNLAKKENFPLPKTVTPDDIEIIILEKNKVQIKIKTDNEFESPTSGNVIIMDPIKKLETLKAIGKIQNIKIPDDLNPENITITRMNDSDKIKIFYGTESLETSINDETKHLFPPQSTKPSGTTENSDEVPENSEEPTTTEYPETATTENSEETTTTENPETTTTDNPEETTTTENPEETTTTENPEETTTTENIEISTGDWSDTTPIEPIENTEQNFIDNSDDSDPTENPEIPEDSSEDTNKTSEITDPARKYEIINQVIENLNLSAVDIFSLNNISVMLNADKTKITIETNIPRKTLMKKGLSKAEKKQVVDASLKLSDMYGWKLPKDIKADDITITITEPDTVYILINGGHDGISFQKGLILPPDVKKQILDQITKKNKQSKFKIIKSKKDEDKPSRTKVETLNTKHRLYFNKISTDKKVNKLNAVTKIAKTLHFKLSKQIPSKNIYYDLIEPNILHLSIINPELKSITKIDPDEKLKLIKYVAKNLNLNIPNQIKPDDIKITNNEVKMIKIELKDDKSMDVTSDKKQKLLQILTKKRNIPNNLKPEAVNIFETTPNRFEIVLNDPRIPRNSKKIKPQKSTKSSTLTKKKHKKIIKANKELKSLKLITNEELPKPNPTLVYRFDYVVNFDDKLKVLRILTSKKLTEKPQTENTKNEGTEIFVPADRKIEAIKQIARDQHIELPKDLDPDDVKFYMKAPNIVSIRIKTPNDPLNPSGKKPGSDEEEVELSQSSDADDASYNDFNESSPNEIGKSNHEVIDDKQLKALKIIAANKNITLPVNLKSNQVRYVMKNPDIIKINTGNKNIPLFFDPFKKLKVVGTKSKLIKSNAAKPIDFSFREKMETIKLIVEKNNITLPENITADDVVISMKQPNVMRIEIKGPDSKNIQILESLQTIAKIQNLKLPDNINPNSIKFKIVKNILSISFENSPKPTKLNNEIDLRNIETNLRQRKIKMSAIKELNKMLNLTMPRSLQSTEVLLKMEKPNQMNIIINNEDFLKQVTSKVNQLNSQPDENIDQNENDDNIQRSNIMKHNKHQNPMKSKIQTLRNKIITKKDIEGKLKSKNVTEALKNPDIKYFIDKIYMKDKKPKPKSRAKTSDTNLFKVANLDTVDDGFWDWVDKRLESLIKMTYGDQIQPNQVYKEAEKMQNTINQDNFVDWLAYKLYVHLKQEKDKHELNKFEIKQIRNINRITNETLRKSDFQNQSEPSDDKRDFIKQVLYKINKKQEEHQNTLASDVIHQPDFLKWLTNKIKTENISNKIYPNPIFRRTLKFIREPNIPNDGQSLPKSILIKESIPSLKSEMIKSDNQHSSPLLHVQKTTESHPNIIGGTPKSTQNPLSNIIDKLKPNDLDDLAEINKQFNLTINVKKSNNQTEILTQNSLSNIIGNSKPNDLNELEEISKNFNLTVNVKNSRNKTEIPSQKLNLDRSTQNSLSRMVSKLKPNDLNDLAEITKKFNLTINEKKSKNEKDISDQNPASNTLGKMKQKDLDELEEKSKKFNLTINAKKNTSNQKPVSQILSKMKQKDLNELAEVSKKFNLAIKVKNPNDTGTKLYNLHSNDLIQDPNEIISYKSSNKNSLSTQKKWNQEFDRKLTVPKQKSKVNEMKNYL